MPFHSILVVDNNPDSARQISTTLGALGYHVQVAGSGEAAVNQACRKNFDVTIVSESLPDGDGASVFGRMTPLQRGMKGVLLVASGNLNSVWKAVSAGMSRVVTRPVDFDQLLPVVESGTIHKTASTGPESPMNTFDEYSISELTSEDIRYNLSREELVSVICSVDYPFAGKDRLQFFDRDTLERVAHLVRRWCQARCCAVHV
jgi:DNA-binding NtrC family response regulator